MVMPFGVKPTGVASAEAPAKVDFDLLWGSFFQPLITDLGYEPVRADAELGASIIREMIERLALSDLVLADVSLPNANVFYEVGIRHAACETGCVLVACNWAKQPFDTQSMRYEPYALAGSSMTNDELTQNRKRLLDRIPRLAESKTPCFEMEGFPKLPKERAASFRSWLRGMSELNARTVAIRMEPNADAKRSKATALAAELGRSVEVSVAVAFEVLKLLRDNVGWQETVAFIDQLPEAIRSRPLFGEQRALAASKSGSHFDAIGALEELIRVYGRTPERQGLLGGRYKRLWRETRTSDAARAADYLDQAIEAYDVGRRLDLNEYYSASNLPLLLKVRARAEDAERAAQIASGVVAACERAIDLRTGDDWVYPTLLVAAFHAGDVARASNFAGEVARAPAAWKLESVVADLRDAVNLAAVVPIREQLQAVLERLVPKEKSDDPG